MSSPSTPVTSRSSHMRGRKRLNAHPIKVLRLEDPRPYLLEMAKMDNNAGYQEEDFIGANGQGLDHKESGKTECLQSKGS